MGELEKEKKMEEQKTGEDGYFMNVEELYEL